MKLIERVLDNISSEEITDIASVFGFTNQKMSSVMNATISGILSAFKARIVSSLNSGDVTPLIETMNNFNLNDLFDGNSTAINTVYNRISEFSGIETDKIHDIIPHIMPLISGAITKMFQEYSTNMLVSEGGNFISELINNSSYDTAINAANNFLSSVFGTAPETMPQQNIGGSSSVGQVSNNSFIQNLFDLFDQDNDGSVMDDIYRMLVR